MAAAFALVRAGHNVTIYDSQPKLGGVLRSAIPSYRLPEDALDRDIRRIMQLGLKARYGELLDARRVEDLAAAYDASVVATGRARSRDLDCVGANLSGVEQGLEFLRRAKAEGAVRIAGAAIVIGGGNTALDCARTAMRCGATKVSILYRRGREEMPAIEEEIEETIAEGVELILHRQPVRFQGNGRVTGIEFAEVNLGPPDASGRRRPLVTDRLEHDSLRLCLAGGRPVHGSGDFPVSMDNRRGTGVSEQSAIKYLAGRRPDYRCRNRCQCNRPREKGRGGHSRVPREPPDGRCPGFHTGAERGLGRRHPILSLPID